MVAGVAILVILAGVGGYFLARKSPEPTALQNNGNNAPANLALNDNQNMPPAPPTTTDYKLSGQVTWQKPAKIATITIFDPPDITDYSTDASYKVGKFVSGPYSGADFIYAITSCDCMGNGSLVRGARQEL